MLPRLSLRKGFAFLLAVTAIVLLVLNIGQKDIWHRYSSGQLQSEIDPTIGARRYHDKKPIILEDSAYEKNEDVVDSNENPFNEKLPVALSTQISDEDLFHNPKLRPWYMKGGERQPERALRNKKTGKRLAKLFPFEDTSDRITNQLMYIPPNYDPLDEELKQILLYNGYGAWNVKHGRDVFTRGNCPVNRCTLTAKRDAAKDVDAILYKDHFNHPAIQRPANQIWLLYFLECPYHTQHIKYPDVFNWTATYRRDSDIVAPYEHWEYYDPKIKQVEQLDRNYATNKTKKVAWFVSNCSARNNRLQYAHELGKHIQVDIYGACGTMKCSRSNADKCFDLLDKEYKFYLAFENSNCKDYITEKFFVNGLGRNILPIVMGARPEDYQRSAPYRSYIHVDEFEGPKQLAEYLHRLDKDDELYNSYFRWKGTGEFINTFFWCRVCSMLHDEIPSKSYNNVNDWWRGPGVCTGGSWRKSAQKTEYTFE